eukprot:CAMPEP_0178760212 /NCGR_PEP_ID=MMETSP0744-20121128/15359_1 /TAXON_ID=913974 /ORGANISM="Nitzschia punctata, Strain CCMP561" /LENGTH=185 /DNA_ID=CAMNT_0020414749 /DNA_START=22 /DNA_END=576 /DNA_ORIENTATION=+
MPSTGADVRLVKWVNRNNVRRHVQKHTLRKRTNEYLFGKRGNNATSKQPKTTKATTTAATSSSQQHVNSKKGAHDNVTATVGSRASLLDGDDDDDDDDEDDSHYNNHNAYVGQDPSIVSSCDFMEDTSSTIDYASMRNKLPRESCDFVEQPQWEWIPNAGHIELCAIPTTDQHDDIEMIQGRASF